MDAVALRKKSSFTGSYRIEFSYRIKFCIQIVPRKKSLLLCVSILLSLLGKGVTRYYIFHRLWRCISTQRPIHSLY